MKGGGNNGGKKKKGREKKGREKKEETIIGNILAGGRKFKRTKNSFINY